MKKKNCVKCGREIFPKDDYIRVTEFNKGKENREEFFHRRCYEDMFDIRRLALGMVNKTNKLLEMAGVG